MQLDKVVHCLAAPRLTRRHRVRPMGTEEALAGSLIFLEKLRHVLRCFGQPETGTRRTSFVLAFLAPSPIDPLNCAFSKGCVGFLHSSPIASLGAYEDDATHESSILMPTSVDQTNLGNQRIDM